MAAAKGRLLLLSVFDGVSDFDAVMHCRQNDVTVNNEAVDITTKASTGGWRELLQGAGIQSMSMTAEGVHYNEPAQVRLAAIGQAITDYFIENGVGEKWAGPFQLTTYQRSGAYNDAESFNVTLESAGRVVYSRLSETIAAQDETDFDGTGSDGTFEAGADYDVSDTITLTDGTVVTVDAVDGGGAVTAFTVTSKSTESFYFPEVAELTQDATSGIGTGFVLEVGSNNTSVA